MWLGGSSFALQAYCDFGGYSLCAIGIALMFGFRFPLNFDSPFGAVGMADLWTRWHMSLSTWLRDYLFKPLGGYRRGRMRGHFNLSSPFCLCGLWHGAAWTYVIWGGLQGVFICTEHLVGGTSGISAKSTIASAVPRLPWQRLECSASLRCSSAHIHSTRAL